MTKYILWVSCSQYYFSDNLNELLEKKEKFNGVIYECLKLNVISAKDKVFENIGEEEKS